MKNSLKTFLFMLTILMALAITLTPTHAEQEELPHAEDEEDATEEISPTLSLRGTSRFLTQKMTCNNYPRVCRVKGSPGPDCCKKKCVNVMTDRSNCGKCGYKCKFAETCCKGKCVNPLSNKSHCGGCNNKCKKGSSCVYGMCSYA